MKICFWTHGGKDVGMGHVCRCLSLARALAAQGPEPMFVVNDEPTVQNLIASQGYPVISTDRKAKSDSFRLLSSMKPHIVVVDDYEITPVELGTFRDLAPLAVIDDLADRELGADLVINSSPHAENLAYRVLSETRFLFGPSFALLRPEFAGIPTRRVKDSVERVLVTMGGGGMTEVALQVANWVREALPDVFLDVVTGFEPPVITQPARKNIQVHYNSPSMKDLMLAADLAVSAGGQTIYELAATGTPSILITVAGNQIPQSEAWGKAGIFRHLGGFRQEGISEVLRAEVRRLSGDPGARTEMSRRGKGSVDGRGAERAAVELITLASQPCRRQKEGSG